MSESREITHRTVDFASADGAHLEGDLAVPAAPVAGAVILHPHPRYGGNRFDSVVSAVHAALPAVGIATLRFDFRATFDEGVGERLDAIAAIGQLVEVLGDLPVSLVGYSFGAWVGLNVDDARVRSLVAIAPPLAVMAAVPAPTVPTLVLTPVHDQFSPAAPTAAVIEGWRADSQAPIEFETVESADHFLAGHTAGVAQRVARWLTRPQPPSPPSPRR